MRNLPVYPLRFIFYSFRNADSLLPKISSGLAKGVSSVKERTTPKWACQKRKRERRWRWPRIDDWWLEIGFKISVDISCAKMFSHTSYISAPGWPICQKSGTVFIWALFPDLWNFLLNLLTRSWDVVGLTEHMKAKMINQNFEAFLCWWPIGRPHWTWMNGCDMIICNGDWNIRWVLGCLNQATFDLSNSPYPQRANRAWVLENIVAVLPYTQNAQREGARLELCSTWQPWHNPQSELLTVDELLLAFRPRHRPMFNRR